MKQQLESSYDCSQAGDDLHQLVSELKQLQATSDATDKEAQERINRVENQIHFIKNKCDIHP